MCTFAYIRVCVTFSVCLLFNLNGFQAQIRFDAKRNTRQMRHRHSPHCSQRKMNIFAAAF